MAAGELSWDESTPGIHLRPANASAAERLQPIWLLPHGVILAGTKAPDKVKATDKGGVKELNVALPDGTEVKGLLDGKNLTTHVQMKIGAQVPSADYADYKDFQDYGVMFPSRIVQKVDGRIVADLTVTETLANPYLIFHRQRNSCRNSVALGPPQNQNGTTIRRRGCNIVRHLTLRNPSSAAYYFGINLAPLSCIVIKRSCRHQNSNG